MNRQKRLIVLLQRECEMLKRHPMLLFVSILAPMLCVIFFTTLMSNGLPTNLPAAIVDEDNTQTTRSVVRILDAMQMTNIKYRYRTFGEAHAAMRRGDIYGFFFIPRKTTERAFCSQQPKVSFYTNDAYLVPANLLMKEMKTTSELVSLAIFREKLRAKGVREEDMLAWLQPISIDTHAIGNPTLDYNVYLSNMIVPGIFILLILLTTVYTIALEWKKGRQKEWFLTAGGSMSVALESKLLPQTILYSLQWMFMDIWFYCIMGFPCHCGIGFMMLLGELTVLASQGFGVLLFGIMAGEMRIAMSICSLWGILSFSLAGFTYPVTDMHPALQALASWFPLRHYYLIYVGQALDGFPLRDVWQSVVWLFAFCVSPLLVVSRYRKAVFEFKYIP